MNTLTKSALAILAISLSGCSTPARSQDSSTRVIEFKSGMDGFDTRTFFYEGAHEVIAIDAQFTPELAEKSIAHLRQYTSKPITWLVITHPNPDKFNGASVFKAAGAKVIASAATAAAIRGVHAYKENFFVNQAKMFKAGTYPQPVAVDQAFSGQMDLVLRGGERLLLLELSSPGVSSSQTVVFAPGRDTLFVGDLIHHHAHAWLEGGIVKGQATPTLDGWITDLKELRQLYPRDTIVYGGRGETAELHTAVRAQIKYLKVARRLVRAAIQAAGGQAPDAAELAKAFATQFPAYTLPYMIEYGAYGLVQAEMNR